MRLAELQRRFVAILYGEPGDLHGCIRGTGDIATGDRIAIYRHNLRAGFEKALAAGFPVVAALCGPEYFGVLAREFQQAHPSRSGDLHHAGEPFAAFLQQRFGAGEYAYFADVAALEWAREQSARAADAPPPDLRPLAAVAPEDASGVRFSLHPAVRLVASRWPVLAIWEAHQAAGEVQGIDPGAGPEQVLVHRTAAGPVLERISAAELALLAALQQGEALGTALDAALAQDPAFDLAATLQRCVARGVLAG